ncbi:MAG: hypothetical protein ABI199_07255 [Bacteroidia bacterium]
METRLKKYGWSSAEHELQKEIFSLLLERKNYFLQTTLLEVQKEFHVSISTFDDNLIEYIELVKAIVRSFLRYDPSSIKLAKSICQKLKSTYQLSSEINFCTLPYPIIHFPFDTSEIGPEHKDGYDYIKHFYTTWTPLNECTYQPISIIEKTHKKDNFLMRKIIKKIKIVATFLHSLKKTVKPDLKLGEFLLWLGNTDHEGLQNIKNDVTMALVFRFTSSPIMYEGTLSVEELEKYFLDVPAIDSDKLIKKSIQIFKQIDDHAKQQAYEKETFESLVQKIDEKIVAWNLKSFESKRLSFMLTLWAQRLEVKKEITLFYLYAINLTQDNLYSLHKSLNYILKIYGEHSLKSYIKFIINKGNNVQVRYIIESFCKENKIDFGSLNDLKKENLPLLNWSL